MVCGKLLTEEHRRLCGRGVFHAERARRIQGIGCVDVVCAVGFLTRMTALSPTDTAHNST